MMNSIPRGRSCWFASRMPRGWAMPPMKPCPMVRTLICFIVPYFLPFLAFFFDGLAFAFALGLALVLALTLAFALAFLAGFAFAFACAGAAGFVATPLTKAFSWSTASLHFWVAGQALGQKHRSIVHQSCGLPELAASSFMTGGKSMLPSPIGLCVLVWCSLSEPSQSITWIALILPRSFLASERTRSEEHT